MLAKTFETTKAAKDHCLTRCRELCKPDRGLCNPKLSEAKEYWRKCLTIRLSLCPHYSYRQVLGLKSKAYLAFCNNPQMSTEFCLGKDCKQLPVIVIKEEQTATFHFGANAPKGPDFKKRSAGERAE